MKKSDYDKGYNPNKKWNLEKKLKLQKEKIMSNKEKFIELCMKYQKGVASFCRCNCKNKKCDCNAEERYRERTGNALTQTGRHTYVKVGKESAYAVIDVESNYFYEKI